MLAEPIYTCPLCPGVSYSLSHWVLSENHPQQSAHSPHFTDNKSSGSDPIIGPVNGREICAYILRQDKGMEVQLVEEGVKDWAKSITPNYA